MKPVYKTITGILLSGIIFVTLLAIIEKNMLLSKIGQQMKTPAFHYSEYEDAKQTKIICSRRLPKIIRKNSGVWKPGEEILIEEIFEGVDAEGKSVKITVLNIKDEHENSKMDSYQQVENKVVFSKRGMYLIELQAIDQERKSVIQSFILLIDDR